MKVKDLNGKIHTWTLIGYQPKNNESRPRSELHLKTRELLKEEFPTESILEEVPLPGEQLYFDFYLPRRRLAVESSGEQHYKYIPHFHGSLLNFKRAQANDRRKSEWAALNNITVITFPFNENVDEWRKRLREV